MLILNPTISGSFSSAATISASYSDTAVTAVTASYASSISSTITGSLTTKVDNQNANSGSLSFWQGSQAEYDAIGSPDPNTFYIIRS